MGISDWEGYWQYSGEAAAHRAGGAQEPLLARFWTRLFEGLFANHNRLTVLDVACGNGAALGYMFALIGRGGGAVPKIFAFGLDASASALKDMQRRLPLVRAVVADSRFPPFKSYMFDIVVSQFGVEYGGINAVGGAAEMVAPGGTLAAVLHLKGGGIHRECAQNLRAIEAVTRLLPVARAALSTGIAASRGSGSKEAFRHADRLLAPAVQNVESVFRECGTEVAGGFVFRLYKDIGHIFQNLGRYAGEEVELWLDRMKGEIATYRGRMQGMIDAALDEHQYNELIARLAGCGMEIPVREKLRLGEAGDAAWTLVARRPPRQNE